MRRPAAFILAVFPLFCAEARATVISVTSAGESEYAGPMLVRRIAEPEFIPAKEIMPNKAWGILQDAPWVSRSEDYLEEEYLEFLQEFTIPENFAVRYAAIFILANFTASPTLNGIELSDPVFFPGETCADPSEGSPGCLEPFGANITAIVQPGKNTFISQAFAVNGSGVAQASYAIIFGDTHEAVIPEPNTAFLLIGGISAALMLKRRI